MLFIVHFILEVQGTYKLRQMLYEAGFDIYLCDTITGVRTAFRENSREENTTIIFRTGKHEFFDCFYNSYSGFPSQEVLKAIAESPSVWDFTIERRRYE